ncbi:MAG: hypothetical protein CR971_01440 [candidate division SR1 bacterium]|nr:MAG: hypothetical protein CR971_01440 [candidate division SR1 bacterium]
MTKVSVITTSYNGAKFIKKAIESVIVQDLEAKEYIIVDDCSTDETGKIIDVYAKKYDWIKVIHNPKNMERAISRNTAIAEAKGEYIAFLDDDDVWCNPTKLKKQVEFLEKHPHHSMVGTHVFFVDEHYNKTGKYIIIKEHDTPIRNTLLKSNQFIFATVMCRKNDLQKVGGFVDGEFLAEDYELWLKLGKLGKFANLKQKMVWYMDRMHNTSNRNTFKLERKSLQVAWKYRHDYPRAYRSIFSRLLSLIIPKKIYEWKAKLLKM